MVSLYSFSRRRLGLTETRTSKWSPLSFQTTLKTFAFFALLLTFYYFYYFNTFTFVFGHEQKPYNESASNNVPEPALRTLHQIPALMAAAQEKWSSMLSKQSKTLTEAVEEYRRRYSLEPPDGFDDWFRYAQLHNVTLIDEYDELMNSLAPLRALGAEEVRRRTEVLHRKAYDINFLRISANGVEYSMRKEYDVGFRVERTEGLISMLRPVQEQLSKRKWKSFLVAVNELAESRVLGGGWENETLNAKEGELIGHKNVDKVWENHRFGEDSLIKSVMKACGPDSIFTKANPTFKVGKVGVSHDGEEEEKEEENMEKEKKSMLMGKSKFQDLDWLKDIDVCNHPELTQLHSAFRTAHYTTRGLYPLLSFGAPSAYSDILFPTSYQFGENPDYTLKPEEDKAWDEKEDGLYWRGSPTGGGIGDKEFGSMHRHRLVTLTNPPMPAPPNGTILNMTLTGADASGNIISSSISKTTYDEQFTNVTFVGIAKNDCNFFECDSLNNMFKFGPKMPLSEVWKWKIVMDVDGWGYSARWRSLIASNSLPLKSTIYHEWYTQRMVPWIHFVPISPKLDELYDVLGYFLGGGEDAPEIVPHDKEARQIAEAGKEWAEKNMRKEDMTIYVWRLLLEMNRLNNGEDQIYQHTPDMDQATRVDPMDW